MKLEKLTTEQEKLMYAKRDFWLDYIFSCKNSIDKEKAKIGIEWLYEFSKLSKPVIIYVDSPMSCQVAVMYLKEFLKQTPNNVGANVWDNVWANVRDNVGANYESFCSYGSISDYGWVSFYDFFTEIAVLNNSDFNKFKDILLSGVYDMIQLNGYCVVSDMPCEIFRNADGRLHNTSGAAITFKDGYCQYYINGVAISKEIHEKLTTQSYTFEDWTKEENEEIKSVVLFFYEDKFGGEYVFRFLSQHLKEVDTFVDKKESKYLEGTTKGMNVGVYTLFKGNVNNIDIAYVRCYCPSTDRMFFLGVTPEINTAKDAIASLCQVPLELKDNLISINRQGEMFSFNFDEKGTKLLKENKINFKEVVSLRGDEYFSKIKFEY